MNPNQSSSPRRRLKKSKRASNAAVATAALDTRRTGKKTSVVWNFFKSLPPEGGITRAICLLCKMTFKSPGGSTTGMRGHLDRKHPGVVERVLKAERLNEEAKVDLQNRLQSSSPSSSASNLNMGNQSELIGSTGETEMEMFEEHQIKNEDNTNYPQASTSSASESFHILPGPPPVYTFGSETDDSDEVNKSIVLHLASTLKPLHYANEITFKNILSHTHNSYLDNHNWNILEPVTRTLENLYEDMKEAVCEDLARKYMSIGIDVWVKSNAEVYAIVTANLIADGWTLESKFLGIRKLQNVNLRTSHETFTASLLTVLNDLFNEFSITPDRLTVNILNAIDSLTTEGDGDALWVTTWPCINKILTKANNMLDKYLQGALGKDLRSSCKKLAKEALPAYKDLKRHPGRLLEAVKEYISTSGDSGGIEMKDLDAYNNLQQPLSELVDGLLEENIIPASVILPLIYATRDAYHIPSKENSFEMVDNGRESITRAVLDYIQTSYKMNPHSTDLNDPTLAICTFLDPRYKKLKFLTDDQRQRVYDTIMELLHDFEKTINVRYVNCKREIEVPDNDSTPDPLLGQSYSSSATFIPPPPVSPANPSKLSAIISKVVGSKSVSTPSSNVQKELNRYMVDPMTCVAGDPYEWWRSNHTRYPILSEFAKKYMCILADVSPAKYVFTAAGKEFFHELSKIEPEFVDKLLFLRFHNTSATETERDLEESFKTDRNHVYEETESAQVMEEC